MILQVWKQRLVTFRPSVDESLLMIAAVSKKEIQPKFWNVLWLIDPPAVVGRQTKQLSLLWNLKWLQHVLDVLLPIEITEFTKMCFKNFQMFKNNQDAR